MKHPPNTLYKVSFAFWAFKLFHVDSAEKADAELTSWARPVCPCNPPSAQSAKFSEAFI